MYEVNKGKRSLYSAITAIALTLMNGLLGLIVIRLVIAQYGSDFNGLNSTANQFINLLLIVEGGFTLATNVALFKPLSECNYGTVNGIMTATRNTFLKIGIYFLAIGILASIGYAIIVKSELPYEITFLIFLLTVTSTAFNLIYTMKYQILIQAEQREYILNIIKIGTIMFSQFLIIFIIFVKGHMLLIRIATMMGTVINGLLIGFACRKSYRFLNFKVEPNYKAIRGTKDVFAQNLTGLIYSTLPIIFISVTVGTMFASVYAVYNSVFSILKSVIYSFVNAPRMAFGRLIVEKDKKYIFSVFIQYEYIVICGMLCILTTAAVLIMPFISLYTVGITDIEYKNWSVALFLLGIAFFEVIHIPSGNIINMSGNFKTGKSIQILACIVLVVIMILGSQFFGFYGILAAVLVTSILLAFLEIIYIHQRYFSNSVAAFLRLLLPSTCLSVGLSYVELIILPAISHYLQFITTGIILTIINGTVILSFNAILNKEVTVAVFNRFRPFAIKLFKKSIIK